jgi:hypothetical protein
LFERLKARFHRSDCGCESGCNTGCSSCGSTAGYAPAASSGAPTTTTPSGEPVKPPKDLNPGKQLPPDGPKSKDTDKPNAARAPAAFEIAPASTKRIEKENKNPF